MTKIPPKVEQKALDQVQAQVARAADASSKQPRFDPDGKNAANIFWEIYRWARNMIFEEPKYSANSQVRDKWLAQAVTQEPYLFGIMQSIISIDKNRGWTLIGGRNQVQKFTGILHGFQVAPDLSGWRSGLSVTAQNYYQSDLGGVVEIGRVSKDGPLAALYTVDPTRCRLTGKPDVPLKYNGQDWGINDYFRVVSMPSPDEIMHGLGRCFASRSLELAKLMVSVFEHYREKTMSKAPRGLLLINGITQEQWLTSLEQSQAELSEVHRMYYAGVQTLASADGEKITAELVSLSELPDGFEYQTFVNMIIFGYALEAGYDPREFWPVSTGTMGSATESQQQHRKSSSKGGLDFSLNFQEKIQGELPETLDFEFEQRDVQGDMLEVEFRKMQADLVKTMFESVNNLGENLITMSEARQLLVESKLIPEEWTLPQEDITATDTEGFDGETLKLESVQRAIKTFPDQDIVRYSFPDGKTRTLVKAGQQQRFQIRVLHPVQREKPKVLASNKAVTITQADVEQAIADGEKKFGKKAKKMLVGESRSHGFMARATRHKKRDGDEEIGQLCPYQDCCHDLAIPSAGWYLCGHCDRKLYARDSDSDYEDYACYRAGEAEKYKLPSAPSDVPVAKDLGPSWASPEPQDANQT